jgi:hypothetical protein
MNLIYFIFIYKLKVLLLVETIEAGFITFTLVSGSYRCKYLIYYIANNQYLKINFLSSFKLFMRYQ